MVLSSAFYSIGFGEKMRVAIYSGVIPSTTFIENLIKGVAETGVDVYLFGTCDRRVRYTYPNIHTFSTPRNKALLLVSVIGRFISLGITCPQRMRILFCYLCQRRSVKSFRVWGKLLPVVLHLPDVFHLQWTKSAEDWLFLKQMGVKMVISFRGSHINYSPVCNEHLAASYRRCLSEYDAYHCVSYSIMHRGEEYGASERKSTVIYPAVDDNLLKVQLDREPSGTLRILSVGRAHWIKGYTVALEAMAILKEKGIAFHYTLVAGGEEELVYTVSDLNLSSEVTLLDNLPQKMVFEQHANADLFLLSSFEEGIANVVLEAMALGTPVVATNCGGMGEVILDGENGLIVPIRNPQAMADAIIRFTMMSEAKKRSIVNCAKETIRQNHLLSHQVSQMVRLYERVYNA